MPVISKYRRVHLNTDVEPSSYSSDSSEPNLLDDTTKYRHKKNTSDNTFRYFVSANDAQQQNLDITIDPELQK